VSFSAVLVRRLAEEIRDTDIGFHGEIVNVTENPSLFTAIDWERQQPFTGERIYRLTQSTNSL
jgi:hypothetical protein